MSNTNLTTCDNCGSIRDLNDTYCGNCGRPLGIHAPQENYPTETHREVKQTAATQQSKPTPQVYTPAPLLRSRSKLRLYIVIAALLAMLVGIGGFELGQLVKGNQQGKISNTSLPSNHSGTIIANTAQVSTTFSSTIGCPTSGGYFRIVNVNSGLVLDVPSATLDNGAVIQQYPYNEGSGQKWRFVPVGNGYFLIANMNSGLVLDVPFASIDSKVYIQQYPYNGGSGQKWQCVPVGNGYFKIVNMNSGLVLDVPSTSSHSPLLQDTYSGGSNQQWQFFSSN